MPQIKIYGLADSLKPIKAQLSDAIHDCVIEVLKTSPEKKFQRFFPLTKEDFYFPDSRSDRYLIIEILMFEGREVETKKQLIRLLMTRLHETFDLALDDIEITLIETPSHNWGIRGLPGDELMLNYSVNV